jgi:hypothetical protein
VLANNGQKILEDIHPFLENILIQTYLKGKGYTMEELKSLPEEEAKRFMKEASTYASGKLAEVEVKARLMQAEQIGERSRLMKLIEK